MGVRTTSTSTISIPIYAAWECSNCKTINFSQGNLFFSSSTTTSAFATKNELERIKNSSRSKVDRLWKHDALGIIEDPINNYSSLRDSLRISNYKCKECGNKEKWKKGMGYMNAMAFCLLPFILALLCVIAAPLDLGPWIFLLICSACIACCVYSHFHFKTVLKNIPKNSMPIIGSLNPELCEIAKANNYKLLSPQEVVTSLIMQRVNNNTQNKDNVIEGTPNINESSLYCRKCGAELLADSEYCHKCGCKAVR